MNDPTTESRPVTSEPIRLLLVIWVMVAVDVDEGLFGHAKEARSLPGVDLRLGKALTDIREQKF